MLSALIDISDEVMIDNDTGHDWHASYRRYIPIMPQISDHLNIIRMETELNDNNIQNNEDFNHGIFSSGQQIAYDIITKHIV